MRVLDERGRPLPVGSIGEICFSGSGVIPGYLDRPELDAEKFLHIDGRRFYRTGDLGRFDSQGDLEILGRRDYQVQIRGIRVELVGIENAIRELGLASSCAVVLNRSDGRDERLVVFVVAPAEDRIDVFRRTLGARLPGYMLPQHLVVIDRLPLTANGKLDRQALQERPWKPAGRAEAGGAPRTVLEEKIARAFREVLEMEAGAAIGIDDNFFDLGGTLCSPCCWPISSRTSSVPTCTQVQSSGLRPCALWPSTSRAQMASFKARSC